MIEVGAPSMGENACQCARPNGGSHGRTLDVPAQRLKGAKAKAALKERSKKARPGAL